MKIYLTGFGKFNGVEDNPSTHIINNIKEYIKDKTVKFDLQNVKVLEVSAEATKQFIQSIDEEIDPNEKILFLHLGVNSTSNTFALEKCGWNEATFRCPDECGWKPEKELIVNDSTLLKNETNLPLESISQSMVSLNHSVCISNDPGRFICNYLYFYSLECLKNRKNSKSLFVHIPPFSSIPMNKQLSFLYDLMNEICTSAE
ncbi:hypothetical protein CYY_000864 [Polysphondylium violaceum]|uniref:Pyroglutamyl-peptidase I n=1 Tax=Polysphondylium violaceum TaxID=133409 RepID=A0A8J4VB44_9MYCE|nr:hypothetical protein CYY_000864 [Polysphondylium violaceum]